MNPKNPLVTCEWLEAELENPNLVIFDATMAKTPAGELIPKSNFYIPDAILFDFDNVICDTTSHLPHMVPSPSIFEKEVQKLGVNENSIIIVYDGSGIFSSPRVWWMFKCMGHDNIFVLNGGLPEWKNLGKPTIDKLSGPKQKGNFSAYFRDDLIRSKEYVLESIPSTSKTIIDARSSVRFHGIEPEPREGLLGGHITGAQNIPYTSLLENNKYIETEKIKILFESLNIKDDNELIFSCGSGVTACIDYLAAYLVGYKNLSVYDGSWTEWGADRKLPISK